MEHHPTSQIQNVGQPCQQQQKINMLRRRRNPLHEARDHACNCRDTEMLEAKFISPQKGRGVFTLAPFQQGDFVVEYRGVIIDAAEAHYRRKIYHKHWCVFLFDFKWKGKWWCIDAALEDNSLGRLVNNDHKTPNCRMKLIEVDRKPHLCLFALRDICQREEITYDYGGTDWPWRNEGDDATCSLETVPSTSDLSTCATQGDDATCSLENVPSTSDFPTCATQGEDATCSLENVPSTSDFPTSDLSTCATQMKSTIIAYEDYTETTPDEDEDYIPSSEESSSSEGSSVMPPPIMKRKAIQMKSSIPDYQESSSSEGSSVIIIRREGEVSSMPLSAFMLRNKSDPHEDIDWALSETEKQLCRHFSRIETRGKRGRKVPILLTPKMVSSLELLVSSREKCGIQRGNPYFFVATLSTVLNMTETEMDQLANFLGHDLVVHREYYRLPEGTLQLAKIRKVLMSIEQGRLMEFKGKNLDEIEIQPHEKVQLLDEGMEDEEHEDIGVQPADDVGSLSEISLQDTDQRRPMSFPEDVRLLSNVSLEDTAQLQHSKDVGSLPDVSLQDTEQLGPMSFPKEKPRHTSSPKAHFVPKRKWETKEVEAIEKHLSTFLKSLRVPGKLDCVRCLEAEPTALKNRNWQAIKFFVHNRIVSLKRKL
ncbi:uncharacterized protein LOC134076182 isoform X1 [Sardina pilchardus]|uniref:uncharacterized protein LOC134076182 isoform X1 n=1 Tax=Sardina pilchardus TaxID=27697 RepID=UPI002E159C2E